MDINLIYFLRFPESSGELLLDPNLRLLYTSTYTFSGLEGSLILKVVVKDPKGDLVSEDSFKQEDRMDRKYGVTTNKEHKYVQQRSFIKVSLILWTFLFLGFQIRDR